MTASPALPAGTKVLVRDTGRVGVVVSLQPPASYGVRFPDGGQGRFDRAELTVYRHAQSGAPGPASAESMRPYVAYRCVVGSTAYGLAQDGSDIDRRGFYLPPADLHWSLGGVPEQLDFTATEECYWEIEKFVRLCLKANPNVLECLYTPVVEHASPLAAELLAGRSAFLSRAVHRTYNAYVLSQFKKIEQDLRNQGHVKWKHVMHLIRLLLSGIAALREGFVPVRVDAYRDRLLAIRRGDVDWNEAEAWRLALHREFDEALDATSLPELPDFEWANGFLIRARRFAAAEDYAG